jgi:hypothetical protein
VPEEVSEVVAIDAGFFLQFPLGTVDEGLALIQLSTW